MRRLLSPTLAAVALVSGCGVAGADTASDAGSGPAAAPASHPTAAPWPAYPAADYSFTLRVSCFCPDAGAPVRVTVEQGQVSDAVFAHRGRGHAAGSPAPDWMRVTLNDVIEAANDPKADTVKVRWPVGQDHPASVWVDPDRYTADEEIGYSIGDVEPSTG